MRHWTTAKIKVTFIVYHERRYVIAEAHSEGIPKLRPVLTVRQVTSWVVKEMVNSVFSYLWGKQHCVNKRTPFCSWQMQAHVCTVLMHNVLAIIDNLIVLSNFPHSYQQVQCKQHALIGFSLKGWSMFIACCIKVVLKCVANVSWLWWVEFIGEQEQLVLRYEHLTWMVATRKVRVQRVHETSVLGRWGSATRGETQLSH